MTATFGRFLDAAGTHIGHAVPGRRAASGTAAAVASELHRLVAALMRYPADVATGVHPGPVHRRNHDSRTAALPGTSPASAAWPETATAASWQRTAQAAAIVGHASELILRSLARQTGMDHAATAARQWDPITTGTRGPLTAAANETADLVVRTGRLAYRNPAWTPARRHFSALRGPAELAAGPDGTRQVLAAVHHAIDAATRLLAADRKAVGAAAAARHLFIPTPPAP